METSKIKTFFINVLLIVIFFLLLIVVPQELDNRSSARALNDSLTALLAARGIEFDAEINDAGICRLHFEQRSKKELEAVTELLGQEPVIEENAGGISSYYYAELGIAEFYMDGRFNIIFTSENLDRELPYEEIFEMIGFEVWGQPEITRYADDRVSVTGTQAIAGLPVYSSKMVLKYYGGKPVSMEGLWFVGVPVRDDAVACISAETAILAFLGSQNNLGQLYSRITDMEQGYVIADNPVLGDITLVPVWRIYTDTGLFEVNGITKNVKIIED